MHFTKEVLLKTNDISRNNQRQPTSTFTEGCAAAGSAGGGETSFEEFEQRRLYLPDRRFFLSLPDIPFFPLFRIVTKVFSGQQP